MTSSASGSDSSTDGQTSINCSWPLYRSPVAIRPTTRTCWLTARSLPRGAHSLSGSSASGHTTISPIPGLAWRTMRAVKVELAIRRLAARRSARSGAVSGAQASTPWRKTPNGDCHPRGTLRCTRASPRCMKRIQSSAPERCACATRVPKRSLSHVDGSVHPSGINVTSVASVPHLRSIANHASRLT